MREERKESREIRGKPSRVKKTNLRNGHHSKSEAAEAIRGFSFNAGFNTFEGDYSVSMYRYALKGVHGFLISYRKWTKSSFYIPEMSCFLASLDSCLRSVKNFKRLLNAIEAKTRTLKGKGSQDPKGQTRPVQPSSSEDESFSEEDDEL